MIYSMLLSDNSRSRAYLQNLIGRRYSPSHVMLLPSHSTLAPEQKTISELKGRRGSKALGVYFDESESVRDTVAKYNLDYVELPTSDVNSPGVIDAVKKAPGRYCIYSGPGGTILRSEILAQGKEFVHAHPGWLPTFRGSTTIYYTQLIDRSVSCSVFLMNDKIDSGDILLRKRYVLGDDDRDFDYVIDPCVRTAALLETFETGKIENRETVSIVDEPVHTFFIIHPVLKHIALLNSTTEGKGR